MTLTMMQRHQRWRHGLPVFGSTAERDVMFPSPSQGDACYLDSNDASEGLQTYSGTAWRAVSWNSPWGPAGTPASSTSDQTGITAFADITFATMTWTGFSNRLYRITLSVVGLQVTSTGNQGFLISTGASGAGTTLAQIGAVGVPAGNAGGGSLVAFQTGSGSLSAHARAVTTAGTLTINNAACKGWFVVEDAGPTGAPV